ncbi:Protein of uncharacterised function (DUF2591) [Enterobacter cloacae]|uniref:Protein of uncharacterized function (DUF2591) n=1 Tax=Enterobacter cloacae TaxID=550 RepID=A0A377LWG8_ENTCL|nr:Protein of uncharacterised function (DUF2591) [Enterobacter cloacae]
MIWTIHSYQILKLTSALQKLLSMATGYLNQPMKAHHGFLITGCKVKNTVKLPDYCNNPADAWPIIVDNEISLNSYGSAWEASFEHDAPIGAFGTDETVTSGYEHRNPLRAAMIAFLMKQEQANA